MNVDQGKLVDKEILCVPLNFQLACNMQAGNLEEKGKISLLHEQWGKYEVYTFPRRTKESKAIMVLHILITHSKILLKGN